MVSAINRDATIEYVASMYDELALMLEKLDHPLAGVGLALAKSLRAPADSSQDARPGPEV